MLNSANNTTANIEGYNPALLPILSLLGLVAKGVVVGIFGLAIHPRKVFPEKFCNAAIYATTAFCKIRENIIKFITSSDNESPFLETVIIGPIMEELQFGFIQGALLKDLPMSACSYLGLEAPSVIINPAFRILASSILFGLAHIQYWDEKKTKGGIIGTSVAGILYGSMRENFGVISSIIIHSAWNFSSWLNPKNEEAITIR